MFTAVSVNCPASPPPAPIELPIYEPVYAKIDTTSPTLAPVLSVTAGRHLDCYSSVDSLALGCYSHRF